MLNIECGVDRLLRALTGLNRKAFDALLPIFTTYLGTQQTKLRQRVLGGGRKARLRKAQDKLFFILFYFKYYPTFDMHCSQAHEWIHRLQPVLEADLGQKMALQERHLESIEAFLSRFPEVQRVMIDGSSTLSLAR
ncbi:MAG: DDE transposase family protein [Nostoc sp. NOS(2021)]|nr:DDE transposase family protein [Nostoc sp. NOS(2021)]